MSKSQSPGSSSTEDGEDDAVLDGANDDSSSLQHRRTSIEASTDSPTPLPRPCFPLQKRRRVTRACDECRRKKIKCDGRQPCTHCTVYSYDCTYDQPSNRRRNPAPQYIEALEYRLQRAETLLKTVLPDVDLSDPYLDAGVPQRMHVPVKQEASPDGTKSRSKLSLVKSHQDEDRETDSLLESMVENTGSLDLDDQGHWDFHGQSSGLVFLRRMRDEFGDLMSQSEGAGLPFLKTQRLLADKSPRAIGYSPPESSLPNIRDLPRQECAQLLCAYALDDACALVRFVHQPWFYRMVDRIYSVPPEQFGKDENRFLPLLYATLALGCLFAKQEQSQLQIKGYEGAIDQGFQWFRASRQLIEITDCRDLISLQAILFMMMFLQCSAKLSTCYSYIGIALGSALRLGLHRSVSTEFDPIEREVRKRVFWVIRKMDIYVGALLGLPIMLNGDDVDQEQPLEVDDEFITDKGVFPMPPGRISVMAAFNAHARLVRILAKTVKYIYPIKGMTQAHVKSNQSYVVNHSRIREVEQELQEWMEGLPMSLRPGGEAPPELSRVQQLLRIAYAHIQLLLYRPFLHYSSSNLKPESINRRSYACAAACVSVSRNVIHITTEMKKRGLFVGAYWFYMYTTFFAIISLVYFVLENPKSSTTKDILRDAYEGKDTLASLAKSSMAADKCTITLTGLFEQLPEKLKGVGVKSPLLRKRQASSKPKLAQTNLTQSAPDLSTKPKPNHHVGNQTQHPRSSPNSSSQRQKRASLPQDSTTIRHKALADLDSKVAPDAKDVYSPSLPDTVGMQTPEALSYNTTPIVTQLLPGANASLAGSSFPDLSAMMFPSADPFAYPNQPITTLENHDVIKQETGFESNECNAQSWPFYGTYNSADTPVFGTFPLYPHPDTTMQNTGPLLSMCDSADDSPAMMTNGPPGRWLEQQFGPSGVPDLNVDHIFREDWSSGWTDPGYGHGQ